MTTTEARTHTELPAEGLSMDPSSYPTVPQLWDEALKKFAPKEALSWKNEAGSWVCWTFEEYHKKIRQCARSFIYLGLETGKAVDIISFNSKEWFVADMAAIFAGARACGIYTSNSAEQCQYVAEHSEAQIVCVENETQLCKFLEIVPQLPELKALIVMDNKPGNSVPQEGDKKLVYTWDEMMAMSENVEEKELDDRIQDQQPSDVCTLIYTSGTTGNPKGVMLTHSNISFTVSSVMTDSIKFFHEDEHLLSYLPLSHIAEQIVSLLSPLCHGGKVYFCDPSVLKDRLGEVLLEVRPTTFLGVPRVWEKIQAKIQAKGAANKGLKKKISVWARKKGVEGGYKAQQGLSKPRGYGVARKLVFSKVCKALGLDRCHNFVTAAAPISLDTLEFFLSLGIAIYEVFGMSECCGPASLSWSKHYKTGWAGLPLPGTEMKLTDDGELCVKGLNVMAGYYKNPEATAETIDSEGWLHTGDIAAIDKDGFVKITDRKKEIIITAGGENVAPAMVEGLLRGIPVVNQAVVIGDRRKYLACLLTLDPERLPLELEVCGADCTPETVAENELFRAHLWKQIEEVNGRLAQVQTVKKFAVLPKELTPEGGELTPTMKLKRRIVNEKYAETIESLYSE